MQKFLLGLIGVVMLVAIFFVGADLVPRTLTADAPLIIGKDVTYTEFLDSNLIENPNFDTITPQPWLVSPSNKGTATITDNYLHITIANNQFKSIYIDMSSEFDTADYVYLSFNYRITTMTDPYLTISIGTAGSVNPRIYDTDDEWHTYTVIAQVGIAYPNNKYFIIASSDLIYPYDDTTTTFDIDNIQVINLTELYGSGAEPSQELLLARIDVLEAEGEFYYEGMNLFLMIMLSVIVLAFLFMIYLYVTGGKYE